MATYQELIDQVADECRRTDKTAEAASYIKQAITRYEHIHFPWNEDRAEAPTINGTYLYPLPDDFVSLDFLRIKDNANGQEWELSLVPIQTFKRKFGNPSDSNGTPEVYAIYDNQFWLGPTPDKDGYSLEAFYVKKLPELTPSQSNAWTTEARQLVVQAAKELFYVDYLQELDKGAVAAQKAERELDRLENAAGARLSTGRIKRHL